MLTNPCTDGGQEKSVSAARKENLYLETGTTELSSHGPSSKPLTLASACALLGLFYFSYLSWIALHSIHLISHKHNCLYHHAEKCYRAVDFEGLYRLFQIQQNQRSPNQPCARQNSYTGGLRLHKHPEAYPCDFLF